MLSKVTIQNLPALPLSGGGAGVETGSVGGGVGGGGGGTRFTEYPPSGYNTTVSPGGNMD